MNLNLGCGFKYKEGFINCDLRNTFKIDKEINLNIFPYSFEDNSIDFILLSHVLEHLEKPIEVLKECYRILKINGEIQIDTPYFSSESAFADIDHKNFFGITTFNTIDQNKEDHYKSPFCKLMNFEIKSRKLSWRKQFILLEKLFNINYKLMRIYQETLCWIFPAKSIEYILVKKEMNK